MKLIWPATHAPRDAITEQAAEVAKGVRCGNCLTLREGSGCECSRWNQYETAVAAAITFGEADLTLSELHADLDKAKAKAYSIAKAAIYRASARYGVPVSDELKKSLRRTFGVEATYHPPRVWEQNRLPV